jgi:cytochrome P450
MVKYPEVQRKAHAELDYVIGRSRLPNFQDRESLPYISAIVKETMRWQPVSPLGGAHCSTEDSEYKGYFIPKGSYVIGNAWSILHEPFDYPEPLEFNPDRFLKGSQLDPSVQEPLAAFGFGRR